MPGSQKDMAALKESWRRMGFRRFRIENDLNDQVGKKNMKRLNEYDKRTLNSDIVIFNISDSELKCNVLN